MGRLKLRERHLLICNVTLCRRSCQALREVFSKFKKSQVSYLEKLDDLQRQDGKYYVIYWIKKCSWFNGA